MRIAQGLGNGIWFILIAGVQTIKSALRHHGFLIDA
jgi:hypothetical protein